MMFHILIAGTCLIVGAFDEAVASPSRADYEAVSARVGQDADAHVQVALWCESHGMLAEKLKHLAIAVLLQPSHTTARGLMGLVTWDGKWRRPAAIPSHIRNDAKLAQTLAEYSRKRAAVKNRADDHWRLALWCEESGLIAESHAHFTIVVRLDPTREIAWRRLGCRRHNGRWMTEAEIDAESEERKAQSLADDLWRPRLERWRSDLKDTKARSHATNMLASVTDPRAVPSVWRVFGQGAASDQLAMTHVLSHIDSPSSTRSLALLAVLSTSSEARRRATETLAWRDPRDAAGFLISLLQPESPQRLPNLAYRFWLKPVGVDYIGSPGFVGVESAWFDWISRYTVDEGQAVANTPSGPVPAMALAMSVGLEVSPNPDYRLRISQQASRQLNHLSTLLQIVEGKSRDFVLAFNEDKTQRRQHNEQISAVLKSLTKQDAGVTREAWRKWWVEELGYAYEPPAPKPPTPYFLPKPLFMDSFHLSCFAAGTPVHTRTGPTAIEAVRVGDQVLTQDTTTGALAYRPVVASVQNPPTATLRIVTNDGEIVTTDIHRFWVAGRGWVMARSLEPGDQIRAIDHIVRVAAVRPDRRQPVFNLEVLGAHDYFAGRTGFLVHDNSVVLPTADPFDAPARLAAQVD